MPKVELKPVVALKGVIEAPDFCPFKVIETVVDSYDVVALNPPDGVVLPRVHTHEVVSIHASICQLCKICQFYTTADALGAEDYDKVGNALAQSQTFLTAVINQVKFLQKSDRIPLVILISYECLRNTLYLLYEGPIFDRKLAAFTTVQSPVTVVAGLPVYFNEKLTKSPVQVVGEIEWSN